MRRQPVAQGSTFTGTVDQKFDCGCFVSISLGGRTYRGVLYDMPGAVGTPAWGAARRPAPYGPGIGRQQHQREQQEEQQQGEQRRQRQRQEDMGEDVQQGSGHDGWEREGDGERRDAGGRLRRRPELAAAAGGQVDGGEWGHCVKQAERCKAVQGQRRSTMEVVGVG